MAVLDWLLDSDPDIRWQVLRDLADAPPEIVAAECARVATEGWGGRLLALQGEDGQWGVARYSPRGGLNPVTASSPRASPGPPRHTVSSICTTSG